jgi:hypothetical protein
MLKTLIQNKNWGEKMTNIHFMEQRRNLQKVMIETFGKEIGTLDLELQTMLVDDMITAFFNRLKVMKKIQKKQLRESM